jgi:hypothetical protein
MTAIAEEMARRRLAQNPLLERMIEVRDRYNGDVVIPVPETDDDIPLSSLAPLLIAESVEHPALYASQMPPNISVPALQPGKSSGVRSADYASRRRKALSTVWDESWWELVLGRMYRHLAGYAVSALIVEIDYDRHMPLLRTRDPLSAYPEPKAPEDLSLPRNCGFISGKSIDWLHHNFPETRETVHQGAGFATAASQEGELWDVVEWWDDTECVLGVLGPRDAYHSWTAEPIRWVQELTRHPHMFGRCPAIIPKRVTMDRIISQLSNVIGHTDLMAKLMYLDIRATERAIFPARYVLAKTGQNPRLVDGEWHDGETGEINLITDADAIGELQGTPDPNNKMTMDRVERNVRVSTGLIPQAGGETYGALRTGRGIDSLMGAALDPKTAELHHLAERYLTQANELCLTAFRKRWPTRSYSVGSPLDPGVVEFKPADHVEADVDGKLFVKNHVHYPIPGMDDINATQVVGQMIGAQLVSLYDARRMHPHVRDPEGTERQLLVEQLEQLALGALGQRAQAGGIPPEDLARIIELVYEGKRPHEAIAQANKEASDRQAAEPPAPQPGQIAAPEQMPGLAMPAEGAGMGAAGGPEPDMIQPPGQDLGDLQALVSALQSPAGAPGAA